MSGRKQTPDRKNRGNPDSLLAEEQGVAVAYLFGSVAEDAATWMGEIGAWQMSRGEEARTVGQKLAVTIIETPLLMQ